MVELPSNKSHPSVTANIFVGVKYSLYCHKTAANQETYADNNQGCLVPLWHLRKDLIRQDKPDSKSEAYLQNSDGNGHVITEVVCSLDKYG